MAEKKSGIDQALIRDLANILKDTDLTEIEVEQEDLRIRVSRAGTTQYIQAPIAAPAYAAPAAAAAAASATGVHDLARCACTVARISPSSSRRMR